MGQDNLLRFGLVAMALNNEANAREGRKHAERFAEEAASREEESVLRRGFAAFEVAKETGETTPDLLLAIREAEVVLQNRRESQRLALIAGWKQERERLAEGYSRGGCAGTFLATLAVGAWIAIPFLPVFRWWVPLLAWVILIPIISEGFNEKTEALERVRKFDEEFNASLVSEGFAPVDPPNVAEERSNQ
jgi:hypothetical protein